MATNTSHVYTSDLVIFEEIAFVFIDQRIIIHF